MKSDACAQKTHRMHAVCIQLKRSHNRSDVTVLCVLGRNIEFKEKHSACSCITTELIYFIVVTCPTFDHYALVDSLCVCPSSFCYKVIICFLIGQINKFLHKS